MRVNQMAKFSHEDAFPVIARLIRQLSAPSHRFVPHDELVESLLRDSAGAKLVESASSYPDNEWYAYRPSVVGSRL